MKKEGFYISVVCFILLFSFASCISTNHMTIIESNTSQQAESSLDDCTVFSRPEIQITEERTDIILLLPDIDLPNSVNSESSNTIDMTKEDYALPVIMAPEPIEENETIMQTDIQEQPIIIIPEYYIPNKETPKEEPTKEEPAKIEDEIYQEVYDFKENTIIEEDIEDEIEKVFTPLDDEIYISFDKEGWVFTGFKEETSSGGLILKSRKQQTGFTDFIFNAEKLGVYILVFERQDLSEGIRELDYKCVNVLTMEEYAERLQQERTTSLYSEGNFQYAETLLQKGFFEEALKEFLLNYDSSSAYLNDRIALTYYKLGNYEEAYSYWIKNEYAQDQFLTNAILGLVRTAIIIDKYPEVLKYIDSLKSIEDTEGEVYDLAEYCFNKNDYYTALDLLDYYLAVYPESMIIDRALFLLARLYEESVNLRDLNKAKTYYEAIINNYPESPLSIDAKERIEYLNRHFFYIR